MTSNRDHLLALYRERIAGYDEKYRNDWLTWCRKVLVHGGELVVPPLVPDPDLSLLLEAGMLQGQPAKSLEQDGDCHAHVARLWIDHNVDHVGTGYALSGGLWRQHSWGVTQNGAIWETKSAYEQYIGVTLLQDEPTVRFVLNNYAGDIKEVLQQGSNRAQEVINFLRAYRNRWAN